MSDLILLGHVMLSAYGETQLSLARQQYQHDLIEEADEMPTGIVNRANFYSVEIVDNSRYDGGFWGATNKGGIRTHCDSKSKSTMRRKRGYV